MLKESREEASSDAKSAFEGWADRYYANAQQQYLAQVEKGLAALQETYNELRGIDHPPRAWTFQELQDLSSRTAQDLVSALRHLPAVVSQQRQATLIDFFLRDNPYANIKRAFLNLAKLKSRLEFLTEKSREQLSPFLDELRTGDATRQSTALARFRRDRDQIPTDLPTQLQTERDSPINIRPFTDEINQQRRFLDDLILEIEATQKSDRGATSRHQEHLNEYKSKRYADMGKAIFEEFEFPFVKEVEIREVKKRCRREIWGDPKLSEDEKDELLDRLERCFTEKMRAAGFAIFERGEQ